MFSINARKRKAFSLIELVIVVVILGIIAAIAIPRMSRGSAGAGESALASNLAVLRSAIDTYAAEHGGKFPPVASFAAVLTQYTDEAHDPVAAPDATHIYGPYLRSVPPLPVGSKKGATGVAASDASGIGWIYNESTGQIRANLPLSEVDARGVPFANY